FVGLGALLIVSFADLWRQGAVSQRTLLRRGLPIWLVTMMAFPTMLALVLVPVASVAALALALAGKT
ncbi:MAG: hypothetical protein ACERLB_06795, partial [Gammaproteobacteria bacterium]